MNKLISQSSLLLTLRLGSFLCFVGWAWGHLYWEAPYGILVWDDATYSIAKRFGISWDEFVGTGANDGFVQTWLGRIGWLYLICGLLSLTVQKKSRIQIAFLLGGSGLLILLSYAKFLGAQRQIPMFVEHGGQILMPIVLVLAVTAGVRHRATISCAIVAVILTFVGHGTYALGYPWPTPASFYGMTKVILHVEYETAKAMLRVAGVLDYVVCVGLLLPGLRKPSALYAAGWGFMTALARPVAGMSLGLNYWGADQFIHEAVLRGPHYVLPLYLFFVWYKSSEENPRAHLELVPDPVDGSFFSASPNANLLADKSGS